MIVKLFNPITGLAGANGTYGNPKGTNGLRGVIAYTDRGANNVYNYTAIAGGVGGNGGAGHTGGGSGGAGAAGVYIVSGTLTNEVGASIIGGAGGIGGLCNTYLGTCGAGGAGAAGVHFSSGSTLTNAAGATITGGAGGAGGSYEGARTGGSGGSGGAGVNLSSGTLDNDGNITGGAGGNGGYVGFNFGGNGGVGGAGVNLSSGTVLINGAGANITGGAGGNGGAGYYGSGSGGAGGAGVNLSSSTLTNDGNISGGAGGDAGYCSGGDHVGGGATGSCGNGGAGVSLSSGTLINEAGGSITGGNGGNGGSDYSNASWGGNGGAGVNLSSGTLINVGSITGGAGGAGAYAGSPFGYNGGNGGRGGAGVYLSGGTLESSGIISGGRGGAGGGSLAGSSGADGAAGDAVQFGAVASTLIVDPSAVFNGQVAANASVNDVLELAGTQSGGTEITLGTQFTSFSTLDFASGAAWKVDVGTGAAPTTGLNVDGFAIGDTMDITNLTPTQAAADFNSATDVLASGGDGTLNFAGISGEQFLLSSDGGSGTDMVLAHDPITTTVTLGSGGYPSSLIITATGAVAPTASGATGVIGNVVGNSLTNFGAIHGGASTSGYGGVGVSFTTAGTLTNYGSITGGSGGSTGGAGIDLSAGTLMNQINGTITGGTGGSHAKGGAGVSMTGGTLTNSGSITGGTGGYAASGAAGVFLNGGTVITSGTISAGKGGGSGGAAGDAVRFGTVASTLVVDPGAVFNGKVVAIASANDVLELSGAQSGGTAITLGTQFTNFSTLMFAAGASGKVDATKADLTTHPLTIDGFGLGDALDITNVAAAGMTLTFNSTTDLLTLTKGATVIKIGFNSAFAGDHFVLTADGKGTDVSLAAGAAATLANLAHDVTNFVGKETFPTSERFMLGAFDLASSLVTADPTAHSSVHGGSLHSFIDHGFDHLAGGVLK
jgi:hypothetical protein